MKHIKYKTYQNTNISNYKHYQITKHIKLENKSKYKTYQITNQIKI